MSEMFKFSQGDHVGILDSMDEDSVSYGMVMDSFCEQDRHIYVVLVLGTDKEDGTLGHFDELSLWLLNKSED